LALDAVRELAPNPRLRRIHYDWLEAGDAAQRTVARLSEQLRRYLDDQTWAENRRVMRLLRDIEQHALRLRDSSPSGALAEIDAFNPTIEMPMERPLFSPPLRITLSDMELLVGEPDGESDALFSQPFVDKVRLRSQIRQALEFADQISLAQLVERHTLEQGVAELIAYLSIAAEDHATLIDDVRSETVVWADAHGRQRQATLPLIVFTRGAR
jgi:hypothetical protein